MTFCIAQKSAEPFCYSVKSCEGELLALTPADFDFEKQTLRDKFEEVIAELKRIEKGGDVSPELLETIEFMSIIMNGMKEDTSGL